MPQALTPIVQNEIDTFSAEVARFIENKVDKDVFKRFRLIHGTYTQRQAGDIYMMRIKIPYGCVTAEQLRTLADVTEKYTGNKIAHITTRQAIQCYFIKLADTVKVFKELASVGLTTRESAGNVVRNIIGSECVGVCKDEIFDYRPYAELLKNYFLRNPVANDLPRKFKIAFNCCDCSCSLTYAHDLCFVSKIQNGKLGFRVLCGGGMGSKAYAAKVLHEFLLVEEILNCSEALIAIFSRHGNRRNPFRARLKYLIEDIGFDGFKKLYETDFNALSQDQERQKKLPQPIFSQTPLLPIEEVGVLPEELKTWDKTNIKEQKQAGYFMVTVRVPTGDLNPKQLRQLADLAEKFGLEVRTTIRQNLVLTNATNKNILEIYSTLQVLNLAGENVNSAEDLVSCPGTTSCNLAIVSSKNFGRRLGKFFTQERPDLGKLTGIKINISGCPNSCGMHRTADIGFQGAAQPLQEGVAPAYEILLGARSRSENSIFGKSVIKVLAKNAVMALEKLLDEYIVKQKETEEFIDFVERLGLDYFKQLLKPFAVFNDKISRSEYFQDYGETEIFKLKLGVGECAGVVMSLAEVGISDAEREVYLAEEQIKEQNWEKAREHLLIGGEAILRGLLVTIGEEFKDAVSSSRVFEEQLIRSGQFSYDYGGFLAHAQKMPVSELAKLTEALKQFVKDGKFYLTELKKKEKETSQKKAVSDQEVHETFNLQGVKCPINYVKVKLKLEMLPSNSVLEVLLDKGEPQINVPLSVKADGHTILEESEAGDLWKVVIKKK